jgi:hypothetical protein
MDADIKNKWVEGLRSGDYQQGRRVMFDIETNCACALGVLCEVMKLPVLEVKGNRKLYVFGSVANVNGHSIPEGYAGLEFADINRVITMNDEWRMDFDSIANYIQENY